MDAGSADRRMVTSRLHTAQLEFEAQARRFEDVRARLQASMDRFQDGRPHAERLQYSAFARLQARLDSMPVIEQAKGMLMAQNRCGPDQAGQLLRRASQRANVKVSVLAARMVEQIASAQPRPGKTPGMRISWSARDPFDSP
jgi:hypothetical protein